MIVIAWVMQIKGFLFPRFEGSCSKWGWRPCYLISKRTEVLCQGLRCLLNTSGGLPTIIWSDLGSRILMNEWYRLYTALLRCNEFHYSTWNPEMRWISRLSPLLLPVNIIWGTGTFPISEADQKHCMFMFLLMIFFRYCDCKHTEGWCVFHAFDPSLCNCAYKLWPWSELPHNAAAAATVTPYLAIHLIGSSRALRRHATSLPAAPAPHWHAVHSGLAYKSQSTCSTTCIATRSHHYHAPNFPTNLPSWSWVR